MTARAAHHALPTRAGTVCALTAVALAGSALVPGAVPEAEAATVATKALKVAASKKGAPYRYGAAGPGQFDCSGLTVYSYGKAGKKLPRTAQAQYNKTRHISGSSRKPGDLVFFHSGGHVYHVAIYSGKNRVWHAPRPGKAVEQERIWTNSVFYGRVG